MSDEVLQSLIDQLRSAVTGSGSLIDPDREQILELVERLERRVSDEHGGLVEQIEDAVSRFETDHVALVATLNRVANALSAGGI